MLTASSSSIRSSDRHLALTPVVYHTIGARLDSIICVLSGGVLQLSVLIALCSYEAPKQLYCCPPLVLLVLFTTFTIFDMDSQVDRVDWLLDQTESLRTVALNIAESDYYR